ncbi:MAG: amidase [Hyphomicrobiaceae bacterium]
MADSEGARSKPVWQWSAATLAAAIRAREISCVEAMTAVLARVRATNGEINAIVKDLGADAMRRAEAADKALAAGEAVGALHGVPVTIKVNVDQEGQATTNGVAAFKDVIAPANAPIVGNLQNAGAIVIGRTNTPEFSFRATTDNEIYGRTMSPWNDQASAGGSSGGAGAAAMMGYGPIHHGNDIGGSLRFPAYACGAATVKPGFGRVPAYNPSQTAERGLMAQLMSVQGVICREVRDVRLALPAIIAPDPRDPWHVPVPFAGAALAPADTKVAFTKNAFEFELHPAVSEALDTAREALTAAGYIVEEVEPPLLREAAEVGYRCLFGEMKVMMDADIRRLGSETLNRIFDQYYEHFPPYDGEALLKAMAERTRFTRAWTMFMDDYPLVLTPFLFQPTFDWNADVPGGDARFEHVLGSAFYSFAFNYMGLPAGLVPASYNDGLPVGVQIVGRRFREDLILDALEAIELQAGVMAERLWARETAI